MARFSFDYNILFQPKEAVSSFLSNSLSFFFFFSAYQIKKHSVHVSTLLKAFPVRIIFFSLPARDSDNVQCKRWCAIWLVSRFHTIPVVAYQMLTVYSSCVSLNHSQSPIKETGLEMIMHKQLPELYDLTSKTRHANIGDAAVRPMNSKTAGLPLSDV